MRYAAVALIGALTACATAAQAADCLDVNATKRLDVSGVLSFHIFPGPPGFADVNKGDTPEPTYVLTLPDPICLTGDADFTDPKLNFRDVQVVPQDSTSAAMRALVGAEVQATLSNPMPAMTGHHHEPLVAWVDAIARGGDPTAEYGTAATAVRGFYLALGAGSGDQAAQFILPELRKGPFDPAAMSAFYGALPEPLQLVSLDSSGANAYLVRYAFRSRAGRCDGRAVVTTTVRGGRAYIAGVRALDGC